MYLNETYLPRPDLKADSAVAFECRVCEDIVNVLYLVETHSAHTPAEKHSGQQVYTEPSAVTTTRNCSEVSKDLSHAVKKNSEKRLSRQS